MIETNKTILFDINKILDKINIVNKQKIADFGCGNFGFFVFPLAKLVGKEGKVYAIDILKKALDEIKNQAESHNLSQIETMWSDLEIFKGTKIETASLDAVILINFLNQLDKRLTTLQEASRLIKTGGKILIVDWKNTDTPLAQVIKKRVESKELKEECSRLGLKVDDEFEAGPYHFGLILKKL